MKYREMLVSRNLKPWGFWMGIVCVFLAGCQRDSKGTGDERLSLFLALTVHNELTMYEKGFASEITNTPTFFAIESSLQANLLRAIHLVSSMNAGEPSKGGKYQLEAELNRAKSVLTAHPVRSSWRPIDAEIDVGESEAILPKKITKDARHLIRHAKDARHLIRKLR
jgi:hypothetical protein